MITICRGGGRATKAAAILRGSGRTAEVMEGGMNSWAAAALPITAPDGTPGHVA